MKVVVITGWILGLAGFIVGSWCCFRPALRHSREARSIRTAQKFMAAQDYRNASLSAQRALELNPASLDACSILSALAEIHNSPNVLAWRRRIADLNPTAHNQVLLAAAALRSESYPFPLAVRTLNGIREPAATLVSFHVVSAEMALRLGMNEAAESHLEQACSLEPTNELHELNLSVLRLQSKNEASRETARVCLQFLAGRSNLAAVALRSLAADSVGHDDLTTAKWACEQLLADPRANVEDRLQHLTILRALNDSHWEPALLQLQFEAATNANLIYQTCSWMVGQGLAEQALTWIQQCPENARTRQPAPLAIVDCLVAKKDWRGLEGFLQAESWGELEYLRLAFLARSAQEQRQLLAAETRWRAAVRAAGDRLDLLKALLWMSAHWAAPYQREQLLWEISRRFPHQEWALQELNAILLEQGDTRGLNQLYAALASYYATNFIGGATVSDR